MTTCLDHIILLRQKKYLQKANKSVAKKLKFVNGLA